VAECDRIITCVRNSTCSVQVQADLRSQSEGCGAYVKYTHPVSSQPVILTKKRPSVSSWREHHKPFCTGMARPCASMCEQTTQSWLRNSTHCLYSCWAKQNLELRMSACLQKSKHQLKPPVCVVRNSTLV
jgi:hypothetical protein